MGVFVQHTNAQVLVVNPTNTTPNLAASYTSLASAITALNATTAISGQVIINLTGNETAPVGGYAITATPTGVSATNNIIIQGSSSTITAFAPQAAGALNDAIFKIIGADWITITGFTMQENPANTTIAVATNNMTEWGVALLYASPTNGAQNNTIINNTISLNRTYFNTFGVYSNTRHSATDVLTAAEATNAAGANSGNKVYGNNISNVNFGIVFIGASTTVAMDNANDIGGTSLSTGNTIANFGGGAALSLYVSNTGNDYAIVDNQQINENISFNTITSALGLSTATISLGGVLKNYSVAQPSAITFASNINNNTITLTDALTTAGMFAVNSQGITTAMATATININNNSVLNSAITGVAATSAAINAITNSSAPGVLNMNNNIISGCSSIETTGSFIGIVNTGAVVTTCNINNNQVGNNTAGAVTLSAITTGNAYGIYNYNTTGNTTCALSINGNNFQGFTYGTASSGTFTCIYTNEKVATETINNNNFNNLTINSSASNIGFLISCSTLTPVVTVSGNYVTTQFSNTNPTGNANNIAIYNGGAVTTGSSTVSNNILSNISFKTTTGFGNIIYWQTGTGTTCSHNISITGNTISNISNTGIGTSTQAANLYGILVALGDLNVVSNNNINNMTASGGTVIGIFAGSVSTNAAGTMTINNNTIYGIKTTSVYGTGGGTVAGGAQGMQVQSGPSLNNIYKNKIYDISCAPVGGYGGTALGIEIAQGTATNVTNIYNNYIGRIYSVSSLYYQAAAGIFHLNSVANTTNVYYNTINLDGNCPGNSFCFYKNSATPNTSLRNNIFVNNAVATGTLEQLVYFFYGALTATYQTTSNNNVLYCTPGALNFIYANGAAGALTNKQQTLTAFQTYVGPTRENASKTENVLFLNTTTGANANYLHIDPTVATQVESGAVNIATYTDDFDNDVRQGNPGYAGSGTAPDIGADEGNFIFAPTMSFVSSTTIQNTANTAPNMLNQQVICIKVVTAGVAAPFSVSKFTVNANGTTNISDITNAHIYYTGTVPTFSSTTLFGTLASPTIPNFIITGSQILASGTNYFWLTYDVQPGATLGDFVDAECAQVNGTGVMGIQIPTVTAPAGARKIMGPMSGDYLVGLPSFLKATGKNITFQKVVKKTMKAVETGMLDSPDKLVTKGNANTATVADLRSSDSGNLVEDINVFVGTVAPSKKMMEAEEISWIPMENGVVYDGPLSVTLPANSHSPNLPVSTDYATITAAIGDLNTRGVSGPVRFLLTDATYPTETFPIIINVANTNVPTATNTVTILPNAGVTTTISGSGSSIFTLYGADFITFDGSNSGTASKDMTIENTSTGITPIVIWIASASATNGATNNTIKNCIVKGSSGTATFTGIVSSSGTTIGGVAEAANSNNTIQNNTILRCSWGIACVGPTGNESGLTITGNTLGSSVVADKLGYKGIGVFQQANAVVSGNTIQGVVNANTGTTSGIIVSGTASGIRITKNIISDIKNTNTGGWGCDGIDLTSSATTANVTVSNNVIYDVAAYGFDGGDVADNGNGIVVESGAGYNIYYNSVSMNTNQTIAGRPSAFNVLAAVTTAGAVNVRDNIFSNSQTVSGQRYAIYVGAANTVFTPIDFNDYYTTGANLGYLVSANVLDLAAWKTATGQDVNSISGNPLYTSTTNLLPLSGSPAVGAATPLTGIVDIDILGNARSLTTPTLGAYELASTKTLTLSSVFLEGLYNGSSTMIEAKDVTRDEFGNVTGVYEKWGVGVADHITVELHASTTHYDAGCDCQVSDYPTIIYPATDVPLSTSGAATVTIPGADNGTYYLTIKQRNHIETVSALPLDFSGSAVSYAFDALTQALDANMTTVLESDGETVSPPLIFGGDVNQDGQVEAEDMNEVGNDASTFTYGYVPTDVYADGQVESGDINVTGNNAANFVYTHRPM